MFEKYQNLENYIPNNIKNCSNVGKSYTKLDTECSDKCFAEYDSHGNIIGYYWHYGDTLNLEFNIDGEITIESDAILLTEPGQTPTINLSGYIGQKAYNIVDLVSWTCSALTNQHTIWTKDDEFTYDEMSSRSVYVDASEFLQNKKLQFTIYNFRREVVLQEFHTGKTKFVFNINKELSKNLKKGIYYCSLAAVDDVCYIPIFNTEDCVLSVR